MKANKRQVGVIAWGNGLNFAYWCIEARRQGFTLHHCEGYTELYR